MVNLDSTIAITESFGERKNVGEIVESLHAGGLHSIAESLREEHETWTLARARWIQT